MASHIQKWTRPNEETLIESILSAVNALCSRFDKQKEKLNDMNAQIKNSTMISSLATELEFNAAEIKECKNTKCLFLI